MSSCRATNANLCSFVTKSPARMIDVLHRGHDVSGGAYNQHEIELRTDAASCTHKPRVVLAWGSWLERPELQAVTVPARAILGSIDRSRLRCLGVTRHGLPRHPLRLSYTTPLTPCVVL